MYFYLLFNSTFIKDDNKNIKILFFGSIAYILTHMVLFISNNDNLNTLKSYFWCILILDIIIIYILNSKNINGNVESNLLDISESKKKKRNNNSSSININEKKNVIKENIKMDISDDSDIESDIDLSGFENSL